MAVLLTYRRQGEPSLQALITHSCQHSDDDRETCFFSIKTHVDNLAVSQTKEEKKNPQPDLKADTLLEG